MKLLLFPLAVLLAAPALSQERPDPHRASDPGADVAMSVDDRALLDAFLADRPRTVVAARPADSPRRTPQPPASFGSAVVFTVDSAYDDDPDDDGDGVCGGPTFGECQLRSAINEANALPDTQPVRIEFAITTGPAGSEIEPDTWRITLTYDPDTDGVASGLPTIVNRDLTVDGLTQPGAACGDLMGGVPHDLRVVLDGSLADGWGLYSPNSTGSPGGLTVRGLVFQSFTQTAISAFVSTIECNYVGTDVTGTSAVANYFGIQSFPAGDGTYQIENNLISGNQAFGLRTAGSPTSGTVSGNLIGTDATGALPLGNGWQGIRSPVGNVTYANNLISANGSQGLWLTFNTATGNALFGNVVGLSRAGQDLGLGNAAEGIWVDDEATDNDIGVAGQAPNWIGGNGLTGIVVRGGGTDGNRVRNNHVGFDTSGAAAPNGDGGIVVVKDGDGPPQGTVIGGPTAGDANRIAGNGQHGIRLTEDAGTLVEGNLIGLNHLGTVVPNVRDGVRLDGSASPVIRGNTVVGNGAVGVALSDDGQQLPLTTGAVIQSNFIGTDASGNVTDSAGNALGNLADGIWCRQAENTLIGAVSSPDLGNTIAHNGLSSTFQDGIKIAAPCANYTLLKNRIYDNVGLGIDLGGEGVTPNDSPEADGYTNYPVIESATNDGTETTIVFTLTGAPNQQVRYSFFWSDSPDPSGHGEGRVWRTGQEISLFSSGSRTVTYSNPVLFPVGKWITMTMVPTDDGGPTGFGSTSEFSQAVQVVAAPAGSYVVTAPAALGAYAHGSTLNVTWDTLDPVLEAGPVRVSVLCPGQAPFVRFASTPNDGQAGFVVPASLGTHGGVDDQASGCTVEVANVADPSRAAESAPFTVRPAGIAGVTTRRLDLSTPRNPARYGLQDVVKWFWDEASVPAGHTVRVSLVCDGRARWVRYADTANDGQAGATLPASFGAYDVCRAEIASVDDPALFGRSEPFRVLDTSLPSVDVLTPAPDDVIAMGQDLGVTWETVAVGSGAPVRIVLVDLTNGPPNRLVAQTTNTGSYTWSVPADLDPAAEYRLTVKVTADDGSFPRARVSPLTFTTSAAASAAMSASAGSVALPETLEVQPARPNPARGRAMVRVGVPDPGPVDVAVYDAVGRRVAVLASGERAAGWHDLGVEAGGLAPGVYVVRAVTGDSVATRTLTVVR